MNKEIIPYKELYEAYLNTSQERYKLLEKINKAIDYIEIIDNRNTYIEISELRHIYEILKEDKYDTI